MTAPHLSWKVDYKNKTITVTARLAFWSASRSPPDFYVKLIAHEIARQWSGLRFKCFELIVKVEARGAPSSRKAHSDELPIELVEGRFNSLVHGVTQRRDPTSDDPRSQLEAQYGQWVGNPSTWGHEFGHVLGDTDGYTLDANGRPEVIAGRTPDIMSVGTGISPETVTRIVRRSGAVDESRVRCPITFDAGPSSWYLGLVNIENMTIHAWACDYDAPSDDPTRKAKKVDFKGTAGTAGASGFTLDFGKRLGGEAARLAGEIARPASGEITFALTPGHNQQLLSFADGKAAYHAMYDWGADGLPVLRSPLMLGAMSTAYWWPGPPMFGLFVHGAKECH